MPNLWWAGCLISLGGSIVTNLGINIQKLSFLREAKANPLHPRAYIRQPLWLLGLLGVVIGGISDVVALGLAAQSIIAPVASLNLVINLLFATMLLHERITILDIVGTVILIAGSIVSVLFGDHTDHQYTLSELEALYVGIPFIIYISLTAGLALALTIVVVRAAPEWRKLQRLQSEHTIAVHNNDIDTTKHLAQNLQTQQQIYNRYKVLLPICYCCLSAICSSVAMLLGKSVAELVGISVEGNNQFNEVLTYVFLFSTLFAIGLQLHLFALALQTSDVVFVLPVFRSFFLIFSILSGLYYFGEVHDLDTLDMGLYGLGFGLSFIGVWVLSYRKGAADTTVVADVSEQQPSEEIVKLDGLMSHSMSTVTEPVSPHQPLLKQPSLSESPLDVEISKSLISNHSRNGSHSVSSAVTAATSEVDDSTNDKSQLLANGGSVHQRPTHRKDVSVSQVRSPDKQTVKLTAR